MNKVTIVTGARLIGKTKTLETMTYGKKYRWLDRSYLLDLKKLGNIVAKDYDILIFDDISEVSDLKYINVDMKFKIEPQGKQCYTKCPPDIAIAGNFDVKELGPWALNTFEIIDLGDCF